MQSNPLANLIGQPLIWIPVLGIILAILAFVGARKSHGGVRIGLGVGGAVCLLVPAWLLVAVFAPELIDARCRTYTALYREVQPGMTRDQVLAAVDRRYPANGPRQRPRIMKDTAEELGFFMNSEHSSEPNREGIFLNLADGWVTRKRYSEDCPAMMALRELNTDLVPRDLKTAKELPAALRKAPRRQRPVQG